MRFIVTFVILLCTFSLFAGNEKIVSVNSVRGEYALVLEYADISGREALSLAREDAKRKALEAVCGTRINIWDQMEMSSAGDVFNSLSINQIDGEIVEFVVKEEGHKQSEIRPSETIFYCIADVKVKKGHNSDPDFYVSVNGLKSVYIAGERLQFDILPYRDCYMKVFLFEDDKTGYMLYPNLYSSPNKLLANQKFSISDSPYYILELQKNNNLPKEINRLAFVFTKTERPFNELETSRLEIERWMAKIPNDQKFLHFAVIEIRDK